MDRRSIAVFGVTLLLGLSSAALAQRRIQGFKQPHEMTAEELAESKARSRMAVNDYNKQITDEVAPIPWRSVFILGAFMVIAAPYALRFYRDTAQNAARARTTGPKHEAAPAAPRADQTRVVAAASVASSSEEPRPPPPPPPRRPSRG